MFSIPEVSESSFSSHFIFGTVPSKPNSMELVLIATKGKHPGWVILLLIAALLIAGS